MNISQFSSVQSLSHVRLCDPMNRSVPGLAVHHQLPEFTQTHVHRVSDAIQPSHPLSSPSPAPNPSQHHGLFKRVSSLHEVAKILELQLHHQSFQWTPRTDLFSDGLVGSPCSPRDSQESSPTPQFKSINSSALSFLQISFWNACCCFLSQLFFLNLVKVFFFFFNLLILSLVQKNPPCASYSVLLG